MLQVALGVAVSALAIYYLLQQVSLDQLGDVLGRAQLLPILVIVACVLGSLVTRAARWQIYFLPQRKVPFGPLLGTLAISYMASTFLPLRAGELVRAVFLGQRQRIPIPGIVGTILLEKLFDFLAIGVMLALLVSRGRMPETAQVGGYSIVAVIVLGFGFVVCLAIWRRQTVSSVGALERHLPFGLGHRLRVEDAARHFAEGTDSLRVSRLWALLLGWTTVTWLFSVGSTAGGMLALRVQPTIAAVLLLIVATSTLQAVPSSPGYIGVYHLAVTEALAVFGIDRATGLGIAIVTWAFSYGSLVVAGMIALWTGGYTLGDLLNSIRSRPAVSTAAVSTEP